MFVLKNLLGFFIKNLHSSFWKRKGTEEGETEMSPQASYDSTTALYLQRIHPILQGEAVQIFFIYFLIFAQLTLLY